MLDLDEPNFKVEFPNGGLDAIVALATSPEAGTFVIGEMKLPAPVASVKVSLDSGCTLYSPNASYRLEALLVPAGDKILEVNPKYFLRGFKIQKEVRKKGHDYVLYSPLLPLPAYLDMPVVGLQSEMSLRSAVEYTGTLFELTGQQMKDAVSTFAKALQIVVVSVYHSAGKPSPNQTLRLAVPDSGGVCK